MSLSDEQYAILSDDSSNLIIEAIAGSGKTFILKKIAEKYSTSECILITYSRALKDEIDESNTLSNFTGYTFHSFATKLFGTLITNDFLLEKHKDDEGIPININILMIDEVQDMTKQYFYLTKRILEKCPTARIILVGDSKQTIKGYIGARHEFLTDAENIFTKYIPHIKTPWKRFYLSKSYRLTRYNADFINKHLYNEDVIVPGNEKSENIKPDYIGLPYFILDKKINPEIPLIIKKYVKIYGYSNILILAASYSSPQGYLLAHELSTYSHNLPSNNSSGDSELIYKNKLVFRTFASCKGLQSKCVIILGLDESYFKYNDRTWNNSSGIPNILSVIATRVIEKLIVIADEDKTLRTFKFPEIFRDSNVLLNKKRIKKPYIVSYDEREQIIVNGTSLVRHKNLDIEMACMDIIDISHICICDPWPLAENPVKFTSKRRGEIYESVGHIYQSVISKIFQYEISKDNNILRYTIPNIELNNYASYKLYLMYTKYLHNNTVIDWRKYIRHIFACELLADSIKINSHYLLRQINNFDWVDVEICNISIIVLLRDIKEGDIIEFNKEHIYADEILCRIDYCNNGLPILFKYCNELSNELILYAGLCISTAPDRYTSITIILLPSGNKYKIICNDNEKYIKTLTITNLDNSNIYEMLDNYIII